MQSRYRKQHIRQKLAAGFTLVETLVALTILMLVVVGPMTIAQRGLQSSYFANQQMTAVSLAQEAIEVMVQMRNDAALEKITSSGGDTWDWYTNDLDAACKSPSVCDVDVINGGFESCPADGCVLNVRDASGVELTYGYGFSNPSIYKRSVTITEEVAGEVASVVVSVSWDSNLISSGGEVVLQTWIYDQYKHY